ncbi:MAG: cation:proton antiporter [Thermodesulfobacteriota bacterium]
MDLWFFLKELVMLLGSAFLLGALAQRLGQNPIVGYLLAGMIVGPLLFNAAAVNNAAELGVALLLFSIGLEFSFKRLRQMGPSAFGGGTVQVLATIGLVGLLLIIPLTLPQALTVGALVSLSSTAVVMRMLVESAEIDSVRGRFCMGLLLLQDIAIVPLVLMVSLFTPAAADTGPGLHLLKIGASIVGLVMFFYLVLHYALPLLLSARGVFANRELTIVLSIATGLGAAWSSHTIGISPALGAFIAGLLLGESPYATQIRADIGALRTIMIALFFASVGMLFKPLWVLHHVHWVLPAAVLIFIVKTAILFGVGRLFRLDARQSLAAGITLAQVGEFSFVLAGAARAGGILEKDAFDLIVAVIIVLMFAAPYMVTQAFPAAEFLLKLISRRSPDAARGEPDLSRAPTSRVLVVGLGPAGRRIIEVLKEHRLEPIGVDLNPNSLATADELGIPVHLGDAASEEVLLHAGLSEVCLAVVTVPDPQSTIRIVQLLRRLRSELTIAARSRYNRHVGDIEKAGADIIIDEEAGMGQQLAQKILEHLQESSGAVLACRMGGRTPEIIP